MVRSGVPSGMPQGPPGNSNSYHGLTSSSQNIYTYSLARREESTNPHAHQQNFPLNTSSLHFHLENNVEATPSGARIAALNPQSSTLGSSELRISPVRAPNISSVSVDQRTTSLRAQRNISAELLEPRIPSSPNVQTNTSHIANPRVSIISNTRNDFPLTSNPRISPIQNAQSNVSTINPRISPIYIKNEEPHLQPDSSSTSCNTNNFKSHGSGWSKIRSQNSLDGVRSGVIQSQKRSSIPKQTGESSDYFDSRSSKGIEWCPVCRAPIEGGAVHLHQCPQLAQKQIHISTVNVPPTNKVSADYPPNVQRSSVLDLNSSLPAPDDTLNFKGRFSNLQMPLSTASSHSISPVPSHIQMIPLEDNQPSTSSHNTSKIRLEQRSPKPTDSFNPMSSEHIASSSRPSENPFSWTDDEDDQSNQWETPTSLISRLAAGMTNKPGNQQEEKTYRGCPSPSMSESSSVSSYFGHPDGGIVEDVFNFAHQDMLDDIIEHSDLEVDSAARRRVLLKKSRPVEKPSDNPIIKRLRRCTSSESTSSEMVQGIERDASSMYGSQDSDNEEPSYLDENGRLPDIDTLLKSINSPNLAHYSSDKTPIDQFMEPNEIGHINHLIKSVADAMITISLPESLYKSKGFTPLDYMDIHLNSILRHFFFVFKNEDFMNLTMSDKIALLDSCTLRALQCTNLYLFNKEARCWHVPGVSNKDNHPVIHISDLMEVFPQSFVTHTVELNCLAANLEFDWSMGIITSCILMYTPLKRKIDEMEKVDILRNKYVNLLLKYINWKHGTYNATLLFPEILKLLDALLLHVEDFATLTLKLDRDEVKAVEDRLATIFLSQMNPYNCPSEKFKENVSSWSTLEHIRLGDIQSKLCMAMHVSMAESLKSNGSDWESSEYYGSGRDPRNDKHSRLPGLMPLSEGEFSQEVQDSKCEDLAIMKRRMLEPPPELKSVKAPVQRDLMMLRKFLEEVTNHESNLAVQNIKEKMDSSQIKKIIKKLCS